MGANRRLRTVVACAGIAAVFLIDWRTPVFLVIPLLYLAPLLLLIGSGPAWQPLAASLAAAVLTGAGLFLSDGTGEIGVSSINRAIEIAVIIVAGVLLARHRSMSAQRAADAARVKDVMDGLKEAGRSLEEFKYALDEAAIVAITDQRGIITYVNEKFCEISRYSREELLGQDHRIINSAYHPKAFIRELWRTIAQGQIWRGELRNRAKDGTLYWVDTTIVPLVDPRGKPRQYLAIRSDITQRKLAEDRLREQAALTKLGELAAIVAHEVRNPLAGLRGSLQVLGSRLPAEGRERQVVGTMIERIDALNDKVHDILLFAGTSAPRLQPVAVHPLLAETAASARAATGEACVGVEVSGAEAIVQADPELLREVFLNLLLNACQASTGDAVVASAEVVDHLCRISILDRGPGIPSDMRSRVFEPFFTTKRGGTGLGLAIVKRLVERQGGQVQLDDRDGGGTAAVVTLPLHRP